MAPTPEPPFGQLDFVYTPSRDVAADVRHYTEILGARHVFSIDAMGTRVAMIELSAGPPRILFTDHLDTEVPVLVYRVASLEQALTDLEGRGFERGRSIELPMGPAHSFTTPGGQRIAIYEATRSEVERSFHGRRDF